MAKRAKRPKGKPPQLTPMEQDREGTRLALRRAVRREQEIQRLFKTVRRLERKTDEDRRAFVAAYTAAGDLMLPPTSAGGRAKP